MFNSDHLNHTPAKRKDGEEAFHFSGQQTHVKLLDFWQWSVSDLVSNATRGRLAEYIVASALEIATDVRNEWDAFDLKTQQGLRIEVKSCAYLQSWKQTELSKITFSIRKARAWDPFTAKMEREATRQAHLYIFALLAHSESKHTLDPLDLDQWLFYPVATSVLNQRTRSQHSITLNSLQKLCPVPHRFQHLREIVQGFEVDCNLVSA